MKKKRLAATSKARCSRRTFVAKTSLKAIKEPNLKTKLIQQYLRQRSILTNFGPKESCIKNFLVRILIVGLGKEEIEKIISFWLRVKDITFTNMRRRNYVFLKETKVWKNHDCELISDAN